MRMGISRTKSGLPAMWECGGGATNTGDAWIICGPDGQKKRPIHIKRRGSLSRGCHALLVVEVGDLAIGADHHRGDFDITVYRVAEIREDEAELEPIHEFTCGEWDKEPPECLRDAISAAKSKATCYHCRSPHYVAGEG